MTQKEKLDLAVQALADILDPLAKMKREMPEGYTFNGQMAVSMLQSPECYKEIAREALKKIGGQ